MQDEKTKEIRYIDLFGGVGGFRLGIERANDLSKTPRNEFRRNKTNSSSPKQIILAPKQFTCVLYNDIDKYAVQTYNKNFGENYEAKDIRTIKTSEIPDFDFLCAGFPCQAFSIAGKRRGFQDTRGTLFFEIARIVKAKRPKIILLENVKGLLNHDKGQTFSIILQTLDELGYEVQWMVLNSKFFGVPQNRERVFIIGNKRRESRSEILPFRESNKEFNRRDAEKQVASSLQHPGHSGGNYRGMTMIHNVYGGFGEEKMREFTEHSPTIRTPKGGGHLPFVIRGRPKMPYKKGERELRYFNYEEVPSLTSNSFAGDQKNIIMPQVRRLTPIECERLQGFPDNWTEGVSDTQRYKQMGNAVTVNVVQAIVERMFR